MTAARPRARAAAGAAGTMKNLLKILAGGLVAFQVLAVAQEWEVFSTAWFGVTEEPPELSEEERREATGAVYLTLSLMRHFYASGGDPRFAERMPASDLVRGEMQADIDYLERNRRRQEPELTAFDVVAVETLGAERAEVRTRESWTTRIFWAEGGGEAEPPHRQTLDGEYLVTRQAGGWRVEAWDFPQQEEVEESDGAESPR